MTAINPELSRFVERVIVPALVERFLRDQVAGTVSQPTPNRPAE